MCGISLIVRFGGNAAQDIGDLDRMHRALVHRGPDGEGCFVVDSELEGKRVGSIAQIPANGNRPLRAIGAVRRLRVSDLRPDADQPLLSADGRVCIMFNGAIYNYRELAAELRAAGHRFHTQSDTEVVLEAYRRWGTACFERLNGMWGLLIVDLALGKLIGSRDRLGIKPLYYAIDGRRMLFCSEPAALAAVQIDGARFESARFFEFLSGYPPRSSALSFFRDVHPAPQASWFEIDLRAAGPAQPAFQNYWDLADYHSDSGNGAPPMSFPEAAERYQALLKAAVAGQSQSDAKIGSLLSGGLDTSTIVALWAQAAAARGSSAPETYSIAWEDAKMSERPYQEAVAAKVGARSHTLQLTPEDVWDSTDRVITAIGQPLLGQELIAQNNAYRLARECGAVVVMDGGGSDEVQAGLPSYEAEMVMERFTRLQWLDMARELHCIARNYGRSHASVVKSYLLGRLVGKLRERRGLPAYAWLDPQALTPGDPAWRHASTADRGRDTSRLNQFLYVKTRHTNIPATMMYCDRNAMSHSVEARFPYLDHRLVELCFSLPASYKVGFGRRKKLLFETSKDYLPSLVLDRKDKKYFVLLTKWMPLREHAREIRDASRSASFDAIPWMNTAKMRTFVDDYLAGKHENAYAVWRLYTAARWLDLLSVR